MNDKSRNTDAACGPYALGNLPSNKFVQDYYKAVRSYINNDLPEEVSEAPTVEDLKRLGEQEFINYHGVFPTCAVFAPGYLSIAGDSTGFAESKSLSMAIQLVTVIVGKRNRGSKWCHVKTLSDEVVGQKVFKFHSNAENLGISAEETSWIRYVKGTLQSFKAKRGYVPGFKIVIISSLPIKRGLGSSSALVVAMYTFLEAITNTYTSNVFEKMLACHLAEKLAVGSYELRIADILSIVVGNENKLVAFDAQTLRIDKCDWDPMNVQLVLIECDGIDRDRSPRSHTDAIRCKEISTVMNVAFQRRTHPIGISMLELLFPRDTLDATKHVVDENERVARMMNVIRAGHWKELGKLLWENYHSTGRYLSSLPDSIERIITALETIEGVFGAKVISRGYGASIVVLVQRSRLKTFFYTLNRIKNSLHRYYVTKPSMPASTLYTYEEYLHPWNDTKRRSRRAKLIAKYYLQDEKDIELDYDDTTEPSKSISLFIPHGTFLD